MGDVAEPLTAHETLRAHMAALKKLATNHSVDAIDLQMRHAPMDAWEKLAEAHPDEFPALLEEECALLRQQKAGEQVAADLASSSASAKPAPTSAGPAPGSDGDNMAPPSYGGGVKHHTVHSASAKVSSSSASSSHNIQIQAEKTLGHFSV